MPNDHHQPTDIIKAPCSPSASLGHVGRAPAQLQKGLESMAASGDRGLAVFAGSADSSGKAVTSHGAYPGAMRELAAAKGTPLVDLSASSPALWNSLGPTGTKTCFLYLNAGESPNYPSGVQDDTHFKAHGAIEVARLVATPLHDKSVLPAADFRRLSTTNLADSLILWPA